MKKKFNPDTTCLVFVIVALFIIIGMTVVNVIANQSNDEAEFYHRVAVIDRIEDNDIVICEDCEGEMWSFYLDGDDLHEGQHLALLLCDMGTEDNRDDEIVSYAKVLKVN